MPIRTMVDVVERLKDGDVDSYFILVDSRGREARYTLPEFHRKVVRHANWLSAQGISAGARVLICPTCDRDIVATLLALFFLGAVPVSVSGTQLGQAPGTQLGFIKELAESANAIGVIAQPELVAGNDEADVIKPEQLIDPVPSTLDLGEPMPFVAPGQVDVDEVALIQFSSGSTSQPKGAQLTHRNVVSNLRLLSKVARKPGETVVSWLPLYHDMGLVGVFLASLWYPTRGMVIMNPIRFLMKPITWLEYLSRYSARVSSCPNFALDLVADRVTEEQLREHAIDLSSLEQIFVGAEPIRPASMRRFNTKLAPWGLKESVLTPVYGLAEATLIVTAPDRDETMHTDDIHGVEMVSVGKALEGFKLQITKEDGTEAPLGESGEVWLQGECITPGYLDEKANEALFHGDWLRTGDLGLLDEQKRLYITGRLKDLIIIDGKNYYAHDIVAELERLPYLERGKVHVFPVTIEGREQMAVISVPTARMSPSVREKITEFLDFMRAGGPQGWLKRIPDHSLDEYVERLVSSDRQELVNDIKRYLLARFGVPVHDVVCVRRIPKTTSGKVKRDIAEQIYFEQHRSED